uniref:Uncharacterized protein n=1 Tax=Anguilla anguilla TaxID=7936 RepID=A0A0E9T4U1_ANGAN
MAFESPDEPLASSIFRDFKCLKAFFYWCRSALTTSWQTPKSSWNNR